MPLVPLLVQLGPNDAYEGMLSQAVLMLSYVTAYYKNVKTLNLAGEHRAMCACLVVGIQVALASSGRECPVSVCNAE